MMLEIISLSKETFIISLFIISLVTLPGLIAGMCLAIFQAATSVHEISLSFVPKIIVTLISLFLLSSWYGGLLIETTQKLLLSIPTLGG